MAERTIPNRQYNAGQTFERTFNDLGRFGRCGIDFSVAGWPVGETCMFLTVALSNGQVFQTNYDGTPPKDGTSRKGFEIAREDVESFDSVTVQVAFSRQVSTDFRLWGERNLAMRLKG